ncbi:MAG TPA: alpha/beta hydrolase, partial [Acidimicrobiales bacterium]
MSAAAGIHYDETGRADAPLVALVHGSMDRATGFTKVAHRLEHDHRVLRYDRRGYARSYEAGGPFTITQNVDDLVALLAGRPAVLVGHSLGGNVVLAAAQRCPSLAVAVVCFEAPMSWEAFWPAGTAGGEAVDAAGGDAGRASDAAEGFMRRMVGDERWERLPAATRAERRREGAALVGELTDLRARAPYDAAEIRCPVLLARGENARPHHVMAIEVMAERFPGAPVHVIAAAGHGA